MKSKWRQLIRGGWAVVFLTLGGVPLARASAPAGRYTINMDTVVDTVTGLTWQRAAPSVTYTWTAAKAYCAGLALGSTDAGGWRLPRKLELESLVDFESYNPAIDANAFPSTPSTSFWSSSALVGNSGSAWLVDFGLGRSYVSGTAVSNSARCVH